MTRMPKPLDAATREPVLPRPTAPAPHRRRVLVAAAVLAAQVLVLVLAEVLRPAAAAVGPDPLWDTIGAVLAFGYLAALVAAVATLERPATSLRASGAAAGGALLMTAGCPISGHHTLGAWFGTELVLVGLGVAAVGLGRRVLR